MQFKKQHNPFKINVFNQLRQMSKILKDKNVIFIFGASIEQIYFYISKFKKEIVGLKENSFIKNTLIQCFSPIEYQDYVIYPFPTYIGAQEPLELKLYCEFIKLNLNNCLELAVIIFISNTNNDNAFKPFESVRRCFNANINNVLQNLTIYHFKTKQQNIIQKINSFDAFVKQNKQKIRRYYKSRMKSHNSLKFLNRKDRAEQVLQIPDEVYQVIQSQKQILIMIIQNSFEAINFEVFTQSISLFQKYNQFKSNKVELLVNKDIKIMFQNLQASLVLIKMQLLQQFRKLIENYETNSMEIKGMKDRLNFLKQISKMEIQSFNLKQKSPFVVAIINLRSISYTTIPSQSEIIITKVIQKQWIRLINCKLNQQNKLKESIKNKIKCYDDFFNEDKKIWTFLDKFIDQKIDEFKNLKIEELKKSVEIIKGMTDNKKLLQKAESEGRAALQVIYERYQQMLVLIKTQLADSKILNFVELGNRISVIKTQYQISVEFQEKIKSIYQQVKVEIKSI